MAAVNGFEESQNNETVLRDLGMAGMLRKQVRYLTDGSVIGKRCKRDPSLELALTPFPAVASLDVVLIHPHTVARR